LLFDHCASCRRCCHVDAGEAALEVTLTSQEHARLGSICIETQCRHLGPSGCRLGEQKPVSCSLYPLAYDPSERQFYFDTECPLHEQYVAQLAIPQSDARQHLASMAGVIAKLTVAEPQYLAANYAIDSDYFELAAIPSSLTVSKA
jgi:hypothetical protein